LRAGLLSEPEVVQRLNSDFACTLIIIDDAKKLGAGGDELAKLCAAQWRYPVEMIFAAPDGKLLSKLNSAKDFPDLHADVASPTAEYPGGKGDQSHKGVFLKHLAERLDKK